MSEVEFHQKTPTGKAHFKFLKDHLEYSFHKKGIEATEEIYYLEFKRGLSKYRERTQSWIAVLVIVFILYGFAAIIIKDGGPEFFIAYNIFALIFGPLLVFYSFKTSIEDFWSLSTHHGRRVLILETEERQKIYDLLKEKIKINTLLHQASTDDDQSEDIDVERTVQ